MDNIGKRLRAARQKRGYSQEEVAELAGLSQAAVSYIEAGKRGPGLGTLAFADVVGVGLTAKELRQK
jgi:transcriptional regulator with XRE-family HTH domain